MKKLGLLFIGCMIVQCSVKAVEPELLQATRAGDSDRVEALLLSGVDPDSYEGTGTTALDSAASRGDKAVAKILIKHGANVNLDFGCWTPLRWAIQNGHLEIVKILIAAGADVNHETSSGDTPLIYSIYHNRLEIFKTLVAAGANVNQKSANNKHNGPWTPMRYATLYRRQEFIDIINRVNDILNTTQAPLLALLSGGHSRLGLVSPAQSVFQTTGLPPIIAAFVQKIAIEDTIFDHNRQ